MSSSVSHRAKILSALLCLVLIDNSRPIAALTETQKLQFGSFDLEREPGGGALERESLNEFESRQSEATISRGLLQRTRQSQSRVQSRCALSIDEVQRFYDASSGQWLISDDVLEELDNDVQAIIECARESDALLFATNQTIRPTRTLTLTQNLTLASQSESGSAANGASVSISERVRLTCPDSGQLIRSRSPSFTLRNLVIEDCNTTSSVIEMDPDCTNERTMGSAKFYGLIIERNEISGEGYIISSTDARCLQLEFSNVSIRHNRCVGSCAFLSSNITLNNVTLVGNEGNSSNSQDSAIFFIDEGSETIALNVTSQNNEIRSFQLTNSTLRIAHSHFRDNRRNVSSVTRDTSIGGGVLFSSHSSVSISSTIFENNYALNGGALFAWTSNISINDCAFRENDAGEGNGGALYGHYNSSFDIHSSVFSKNRGYFGAGLYSNYTMRVDMTNVSVWENNCSRSCAISIRYGSADIEASEFFRNRADRAGAALCTIESKLSLKNSTFFANNASFGGACVFEQNSTVRASTLLFENNTARQTDGGGICLVYNSRMRLRDSVFRNNYCVRDGGAIFSVGESEAFLKGVVFLNNTSGDFAGALEILTGKFSGTNLAFTRNRATNNGGGAIRFYEANSVSVSNSTFEGNDAESAGAVQFHSTHSGNVDRCTFVRNSGHDGFGGAIGAMRSNVNISTSTFYENIARVGGSISFTDHCNSTIVDSSFENNAAEVGRGVIILTSTSSLVLSNSSFSGNRAQLGGVLYVNEYSNASLSRVQFVQNYARSGGCLCLYRFSKVSISDSLLSNNTAESRGGAIDLRDNSELTISNSTLLGNSGGSFGGGVQVFSNSSLELTYVRFERNEATWGGAVHLSESSNATISHCAFTNNSASYSGGAVELESNSTSSFTNTTFSGNKAVFGGGLDMLNNCTALVLFSSFARNNASTSGGGIRLQDSNMFLSNSQLDLNTASYGGSLHCFNASVEVINSTISRSNARRQGGAIRMHASNATLERVRLGSNEAMESGGGIAVVNASSLLCYSCWIVSNRAFSGAGMYAFSNDSIPIVAQLHDSRLENNSAASYGGGIEFASSQNGSINCSNPQVICGHIILMNTSFEGNYANHSGAVVLTTDPNMVLVNCEGRRRSQSFVSERDMESFDVLNPKQMCTSWERNRVSSTAYGDTVGTYGQEIVLAIDPEDEVRLVGSTRTGYVLENVSSGRQLPTINVTILDGYGFGPAPTLPHSFEARLSSLDGFFRGVYPANISAGSGNFSEVAGFARPGNYTLEIRFDNPVLEKIVVIVRVRECQVGEEPTRDGLTCQECDTFSYNFNASEPGGCKECPDDASCDGRFIVPKNGHWHKSPCHDTIQECLLEEACTYKDREESLMNFTQNSTGCDINETTIDSYSDALCNEGYKGPLCGSCKKSFGLSLRFLCLKCTSTFLSLLTVAGITLYLLGASSLTIKGCLPSNLKPEDYQPGPSQSASASKTAYRDPEVNVEMVKMMVEGHVPREYIEQRQRARNLQKQPRSNQQESEHELTRWRTTEIFKIMLNFLQTIAVAATISVNWTRGMLALFETSEYAGALTTVAVSRPVDCLISSTSAVANAIWRMLVSLFVPGAVMAILVAVWGHNAFKEKRGWTYFGKRFTLSAIAVTYISYLGLTKMAVRAFYCVSIYNSSSPAANTKERFWVVDTAIKCYGKDHSGIIAIAVIVIFMVTVCFPLVSAIILSRNKEEQSKRESWIFETAGFLFRVFKKKLVFWESVVMFRKACLSVIVVFSYPLGGNVQGLLASVLLLFCLYLQLTLKPYRKEFKALNQLESFSLLVSAVTFNLGLFFVHDRCSDLVRTLLAAAIIFANSLFFLFLLFSFLNSAIIHLRVALRFENIPLANDAPWWVVVKSLPESK